jgi:type IV secretory pathway protease TraF
MLSKVRRGDVRMPLLVVGVFIVLLGGLGVGWYQRMGEPMLTLGASLPTVLVGYKPGPVQRGQIARLCFPTDVVAFTDRLGIHWAGRGCPNNHGHVAKIVAAQAGDFAVIRRDGVYVNGSRFPMSAPSHPDLVWSSVHFDKQFVVPSGYVLLLGWNPDSIDSRYVGLFPVSSIEGRLTPIWPSASIFASTNKDIAQ